jgi:outer membrane protein assembly factor BamE
MAVAPLRVILFSSLLIGIVSLSACDMHRHRPMRDPYPTYPHGVRCASDRGNSIRGMNEDQVFLALGQPVCKKDVQDQGKLVTVWLYPPIGRDACITADFRVYFEDGTVTTWDRFTIPTRYTDPPGGAP